jgi:hypothetical protein
MQIISSVWDMLAVIKLGHMRLGSRPNLRMCLPIGRIYLKVSRSRVKVPYYNLMNVRIKSAHMASIIMYLLVVAPSTAKHNFK